MKNVLIVDDDSTFRLGLAEAMSEYADEFRTLTARDGDEALETLRDTPVDVLVTDMRMPGRDGFSLLAHVANVNPDLPVIVMTAYGTSELKERLEPFGLLACVEKPIDFDEFIGLVHRGLRVASEGTLRGIRLPAFLQLLELERKTCTLTVTSADRVGHLYFRHGQLIDADTGSAQGEAAAYEIVIWESPEIEIEAVCPRTEHRITTRLATILMDSFRLLDERAEAGRNAAGSASEPGRSTGAGAAVAAPAEAPHQPEDGREEEMTATQDVLNRLTDIEGVSAACLVGRDGFLLESSVRGNDDPEIIAAIAASGFGASVSMGRELEKGAVIITIVEYDTGPVLLSPVGEAGVVVVVAEKNANLGLVRLHVKRHAGELAPALA